MAKIKKKETFVQGILTLMFSQVLIKLLGLVYTLYLTNKEGFGDKGNGIVSAGYQIYAMLLTVSSIGVPSAIAKLVSERNAVGDTKGAHRVFKIAFATFSVIGLIGSLMLFSGANMIANDWLKIPEASMTLVTLSPAIFFVAISSVMRGYFNGTSNVKATARAQSLEQVFKTALTIIFVEIIAIVSNTSTTLMAGGATLATTVATFAGFGYLYLYYKTKSKEIHNEIKKTKNYKYERVSSIIKKIMWVSIPITLTAILSSINKNIDSFTVVSSLKAFMPNDEALAQYGILGGKVDMLIGLPLSINVAFVTVLVPTIASAKAKKDNITIQSKTGFSILVAILIGLACTIGLSIFASPILRLLFPNASSGVSVLQISSFTIIFTMIVQTINAVLQGYGKLIAPVIAFACGVVVKLILNLILVPIEDIGVHGAAIGSVACHMVACLISIWYLKRNVKIKLSIFKYVIKPLIAVCIMGICSYYLFITLNGILGSNMAIILAMIFAVVIYAMAIIALKIFTKDEIKSFPQGAKILCILEKMKIY